MARDDPQTDHVDVIIVGAGMSGVDAAYRLQTLCSDKNYLVLEMRDRIGGTWDLFHYPGVRSDSDMYTLGFPFRPWASEVSIAKGDAIRDYVEETARIFEIGKLLALERKALIDMLERPARRHEQIPQARLASLRLQLFDDLDRLPAAAFGLLLVIVTDSRADLGVHEIADAIAERSLSFRKVKVHVPHSRLQGPSVSFQNGLGL